MRYTITGATGHLGSQITNQLLQRVSATTVRLAVHTVSKAAAYQAQGLEIVPIDYFNEASLVKAFAGTDVLIYVASKSHDSYSRVTELENVIQAAQKAQVGRILSMGFIADQATNPFDLSAFYGYLPRRLAAAGIPYTILRNALYADPLIPYLPELIQRQHLIYPVGQQALAFISQADSAVAFASAATTDIDELPQKIYTLTQPKAYTMAALGKILTKVTGHQIGYEPVTNQAFADLYDQQHEGHMLASMYAGGALGLLGETSEDYEKIVGHPATDLLTFLTRAWHQAQE